MTIHPLISSIRPSPIRPRCRHYIGMFRCQSDAVTWLVSPDDRAIMPCCDLHATACLDEYAAKSAIIPELAGWYGVPIAVQP